MILGGSGWLICYANDILRGPGWYFGRVDMKGQWIDGCTGPYPSHAAASEALDKQEL